MPICTVTGTLRNSSGVALPNTPVSFLRGGVFAQAGAVILERLPTTVSDAFGEISIDLLPGVYLGIALDYKGSRDGFQVGVPDAPTADLADIIDQAVEITPSILALAVAARDAAIEAADRVDLGALDDAVAATAADRLQTGADAVAASGSADLSQAWAESPTAPGDPGSKSAKTWAEESEAFRDQAFTAYQGRQYGPRADFVTDVTVNGYSPAVGTVVTFDGVQAQKVDGTEDVLGSLPGWVPFGRPTPPHWGQVAGSETLDLSGWAAYCDGRKDGLIPLQDGVTYKIADELVFMQDGTEIEIAGTLEQMTWGFGAIQFFGSDCKVTGRIVCNQPKTMLSEALASRFYGEVARARCSAVTLFGHDCTVDIVAEGFVTAVGGRGPRVWRPNVTLAGGTTTTIVLAAEDQRETGFYVGGTIRVLGGVDAAIKTITAYDGPTNTVTVDSAWSGAQNGTGRYYSIFIERQRNTTVRATCIRTEFSIVFNWVDGLFAEKVECYFGEQSQQVAAPPHSLYITGDAVTNRSRNVVVGDNITIDQYGSAYKFRGVDGLTTAVLQAHRSRGISHFEGCTNVVCAGGLGTQVGALSNGRPHGFWVTGGKGINLGDLNVEFDAGFVAETAAQRPVGLYLLDNPSAGDLAILKDVTWGAVNSKYLGVSESLGVLSERNTGSAETAPVIRASGQSVRHVGGNTATAIRVTQGTLITCEDTSIVANTGTATLTNFNADATDCRIGYDPAKTAANVTNSGSTRCFVHQTDPSRQLTYRPQGQLSGNGDAMAIETQGGSSTLLRTAAFAGLNQNIRWRASGAGAANLWNIFSNGDSETGYIAINGNNSAIRFGASRMRISNGAGTEVFALMENGNFSVPNKTPPASATATGLAGEWSWDADYIYICTAVNTWKRTAIATW